MVMFFLPFAFYLCFLSLIFMRTDLVVETPVYRKPPVAWAASFTANTARLTFY